VEPFELELIAQGRRAVVKSRPDGHMLGTSSLCPATRWHAEGGGPAALMRRHAVNRSEFHSYARELHVARSLRWEWNLDLSTATRPLLVERHPQPRPRKKPHLVPRISNTRSCQTPCVPSFQRGRHPPAPPVVRRRDVLGTGGFPHARSPWCVRPTPRPRAGSP